MTGMQGIDPSVQRVGEEWIRSIVEKDFQNITEICQPEVYSRTMTPKRMDAFENATDLTQKVEGWFHECSGFQKEQTRFAMVGEKLGIFYRLSFEKNGEPLTAEQQVYCTLREGRIDNLSLLCSGFQPVQTPVEELIAPSEKSSRIVTQSTAPAQLRADAYLKFETGGGNGSTCSILTPSIKRKLGEMSSGQVLEVQVDDSTAKDDIEAWCRLSGNPLLKMNAGAGPELSFYLMKK